MPAPLPTAPYDPLTAKERELLFRAAAYLNPQESAELEKAVAYAFHAHDGQTRKSGEPYITHPIAVATQLAIWHMDIQGLCAGVMHDVLEDTGVTKTEMAANFGEIIAEMVDGLSKLEKLKFEDHAEHQAESFRKLILAMTKDVRVIIVKLADRLHNMRTLGSMRPDKRRRIAKETLEIYAQIANRIGLNNAYQELQDLSFQNLHPKRYETLQKAMNNSRKNRRDVAGKVLRAFGQRLVSANIEAKIKGREKNLYSIHQKMLAKKLRFAEVMDIYGFRVIVNSIPACYAALGALHNLYQPKPGRFKDYIAIPKSNGYQSLHTTLVGPYGLPIEVQIRTREMDAVAEGGVAGHWIDKSGRHTTDQAMLHTNRWLKTILDLQASSANAIEFLEHVKVDLFPNEIYVLTPKGKILTLPKGATPIDFAYTVHTDIGHKTVAARINNTMMPLRTKLKTGDSVEIITSEHAKPNPTWLSFAVSGRARSAIRQYIKNMNRQDAIALGENLLQKALSSLLPQDVLLSDGLREKYLSELSGQNISFEELLYNVGTGNTLPVSVAMHIAELAGEHFGSEVKLSPVKVNGQESGRIHLAECCHPIAGDAIRAVLIKDKGMIIHRDTCPTLLKTAPEQQLDADWDSINNQNYRIGLHIQSEDTHGLLAQMAQAISGAGADISSVETPSKTQTGTEGFVEFLFMIKTKDLAQLNQIIHDLHTIPHVRKVIRV
ncbi:bifunctional (p)ppGpp synthetase/guanosine-3',5'-bis(diphosphate) 3'-pyrophosphohydrolase [Neisseria sp. ZJ106]|uniref:Bifunctional (P)ppGpp synthetase/guanosine-3',5'-bis(Diphosphate) 3'-pyrophosphohydrolase n=1 Tax=Neisseria lisongii TaxID=2912188 RepID=A0ABY7RH22_9NEIS|nr:bifunctional (p)ppGpp synthetase/guanosine-3',5'-bis(diphosphate) 3'-pyrophosphohydrolase [Neisseria lisongii]MCF7521613.1 bifunctional (p)ppGpp synthetase/guanosine-3',5'-bis(diphosphate) 3'-pyrophosphohydrolase [Neisseria lisongii]WCL70849.1 bifunctional (p)ppGpp synthetase/guanosine-3',5'-bis(diphosphate) 3'-pyrophosphohydrolase [Neisseria lisongii]